MTTDELLASAMAASDQLDMPLDMILEDIYTQARADGELRLAYTATKLQLQLLKGEIHA